MEDDCLGTRGRLPHEVAGDEFTELFTMAITSTMRTMIRELRDVFEVETSNLEARLRSPHLTRAPTERQKGMPNEMSSPLTEGSLSQASDASQDGVEPVQVKGNRSRRRKQRPQLESLERDMMDAAFNAKFGQRRGGDPVPNASNRHHSPSPSLVPMRNFESPVPPLGQVELRMNTNVSTISMVPLLRSRLFSAVPFVPARLFGVVPWHGKWKYLSAAYQGAILLLLCSCISFQCFNLGALSNSLESIDLCLTIGALLSLLGCGAISRSRGLVHCVGRLDACVEEYLCQYLLDRRSFIDALASFVIITFLVVFRALPKGTFDISDRIFAFASCVISATVCYLVRMCTVVVWLVDAYCAQMVSQNTYVEAVKEWYLLDSLCRLLCSTVQYSFLSMQVTSMAMLIFLFSLCIAGELSPPQILTSMLSALGMMRLWFHAAMVSDKCKRVPRLYNNAGNGQLDTSRTQVVEYIQHCQSGFDLFGMRINFELTLKLVYAICAASFTLISRVSLQAWNT